MNDHRRQDPVSEQLREVERQVDSAYLLNPLVGRPFAEAVWYFLAFSEDKAIKPFVRPLISGELDDDFACAAMADQMVNDTKWPMRWLRQACPTGGRVPCPIDEDKYQSSWDLANLGSDYMNFESAFTYATLGLVELHLDGRRITPSGLLLADTQFEAYDRLADSEDTMSHPDIEPVIDLLSASVHVNGQNFSYPINPRVVKEAAERLEPGLSERFKLPCEWAFPNYSMGEYTLVAKTLWVISALHFCSRLIAVSRGCYALGYAQSVLLMGREELERRLVRYSGMKELSVQAIVSDLTYGSGGLKRSDPALQPLIEMQPSQYAWAPGLLMNMALERNMTVLINRMPDMKKAYARYSQEKESLLRKRITDRLEGLGLCFWNGTVPWKEPLEIDLVVISHEEQCCLLLELKSFIGPAEPREIRDRSEEIARGIQQVKTRKLASSRQPEQLMEILKISSNYECTWAVVSETSVGGGWVQDAAVPVVRAGHFMRKIAELRSLRAVARWLSLREYLPSEGRDYSIVQAEVKIGGWELAWYGMQGRVGRPA
jgi:hypothetical protein